MKLIDWTKVPRGTMTNYGEVLLVKRSAVPYAILFDGEDCVRQPAVPYAILFDGEDCREYHHGHLRIVPQTRWTYHDGGECPVLDGLTVDHITRAGFEWDGEGDGPCQWEHLGSNSDVIAYRITGVDRTGGFTDCPEEVTE
jgi:hypothetical protein